VGYLALAGCRRNCDSRPRREKYVDQAMSSLDNMTERERYTTRGMFYRLTLDFKKCKEEHSLLIEKFKADIIGRNQLALCASNLRDLKTARDVMQGVVDILPERAISGTTWRCIRTTAATLRRARRGARGADKGSEGRVRLVCAWILRRWGRA
jgi:hypothetical protein